ncbi:YoaK family protein [Clostridium oryzae]|uniref:DUF1275 domain-containing protein n=1 Tax=Clostridium oryzae TaxID=1450648 RepID=A0A1V4II73_9CLOT|nr:YoaK family protein [Clostridium oryzae]OPJ59708.1 hypothetical protein CLORY_31560 [Clostridium oryzae]
MTTNDVNNLPKNKFNAFLASFTSESIMLGILLAIVGGLLDAYTFIGKGGVFSNAQTGNIVLVGVYAFEMNWSRAVLHLLPIFAFIAGVITSEIIKKKHSAVLISKWEHMVLVFEFIILFIIGFLPNSIPDSIVNISISFATSLQYCAFKKLSEYPYATTMCTGNLRSASQAAYTAFTKKDHEAAIKAVSYFLIIFSFISGAFLGGLLTFSIGDQAVWGADVLLLLSLILLELNKGQQ